jgi:hypothetical protein
LRTGVRHFNETLREFAREKLGVGLGYMGGYERVELVLGI